MGKEAFNDVLLNRRRNDEGILSRLNLSGILFAPDDEQPINDDKTIQLVKISYDNHILISLKFSKSQVGMRSMRALAILLTSNRALVTLNLDRDPLWEVNINALVVVLVTNCVFTQNPAQVFSFLHLSICTK